MDPTRDTGENGFSSSELAAIVAALSEILASQSFANADRLKSFLEYVVTETLEGRGNTIRGKTIAQDVYARDAVTDGDPENVVRVDARRLRRRLTDYYDSEGKDADIRIHIDSGGYTPRFEIRSQRQEETASDDPDIGPGTAIPNRPGKYVQVSHSRLIAAGFLLVFIGIGLGLYLIPHDHGDTASVDGNIRNLERQALLEKSPATLQAVNMAEQARGLIFPILDPQRQKLSLGFFQQAIELDPNYFGGYAGAAITTGTLALLRPDGEQKEALRAGARGYADKAIELAPTDPWSQASASWASLANGDTENALRLSERAYALAPEDQLILGIYGIVAIASSHFELAIELTQGPIERGEVLQRAAIRNIYAVANYFLGNHQEALDAIQLAAENGEPVGPNIVAYRVAAYHALGDMAQAQKHAKILQETWPVPIDKIMGRIIQDPERSADIGRRLRASGWQPPSGAKLPHTE